MRGGKLTASAGRTRLPAGGSHAAGDHPVRRFGLIVALDGRHPRFHHEPPRMRGPGHSRLHGNGSFTELRPMATLPVNVDFAGSSGKVTVAAGSMIFRTDGSDIAHGPTRRTARSPRRIVPVSPPSTVTAAVAGQHTLRAGRCVD